MKKFAKALRRDATSEERILWTYLRDRRFEGYKFRRQVPIGPFIADFVCFEARLIVELDGSQHVESDYDARRDRWLMVDGFRVLRFWNPDVKSNLTGVGDAILAAIKDSPSSGSAAPSHLLPRGEKGVPR